MKRKFVLIAVVLLSLGVLAGYEYKESINREKEFVLTDLVFNALRIAHYDKKIIDDEFSRQVFDLYIERLDYTKKFLLKKDIDRLRQYRDKIDDELKTNSSEFFELSAELINQRIDDAEKYYKEILAEPFDYKKNEYIEVDDKKNDWAEDETALRDSWRKALKYQTLLEINTKLELQETAKEKNDTTIEQKSFEEIEKAAREKVRKRNEDWFRRLKQVEHFDRLSTFLNAIANDYDPHT